MHYNREVYFYSFTIHVAMLGDQTELNVCHIKTAIAIAITCMHKPRAIGSIAAMAATLFEQDL